MRGLAVVWLGVAAAGCLSAPDAAHRDARPDGDGDGDGDGGSVGDRDAGAVDSGTPPGCDVILSDGFGGTDIDFDLWQGPTQGSDSTYSVGDDELTMVAQPASGLAGGVEFTSIQTSPTLEQVLHARLRGQTVGPAAAGGVAWRASGGADLYSMSVRDGHVVALRLQEGETEPTPLCIGCPVYEDGKTIEVRLRSDGADVFFEVLSGNDWEPIASAAVTDLDYAVLIGVYAPDGEEVELTIEQVGWYQCTE
ncbi:MAG TPA: hypothetical protein VMZ28_08245 [Kofleriaceae bacterium]|nr:hypothetical protein [Kofleriaceae bacterium]